MDDLPPRMAAVLLTGHGGPEKLVYREDVPVPVPGPDEVLIRVAAAGVNNTDINTRTGWYSKVVRGATGAGIPGADSSTGAAEGGWTGTPLVFPRIQGADCCGRIVAVGAAVDPARIGERVIVRTMQHHGVRDRPFATVTLGSEFDGAFAQYMKAADPETYRVDCGWSDAELASIPCAWLTAENMLHRSRCGAERVLVTGASGGVGSAAVQLAKRRGAEVIALSGADKAAEVAALGADRLLGRDADLVAALGRESVDLAVDLVAGPNWPRLVDVLKVGGRYVTSGAIAGPIVELDMRTLYLKDLTFFGCTYQGDEVFADLIGYIERGEIRPLVARTYPLRDIAEAQRDFLAKRHTGKLVLIPPD